MESLTETLSERVDKLIEAQKGSEPLLTVTPAPVVISELLRRCEGLEHALRAIAADMERVLRDLAAGRHEA